jgi:hypothetical protein
MPAPNDNDPLPTTDSDLSAAKPARDDTADAAPVYSVTQGSTGPYMPGAAAAPSDTEPELRYASAEALAEDLRRWAAGEPITARPAMAPLTREQFEDSTYVESS